MDATLDLLTDLAMDIRFEDLPAEVVSKTTEIFFDSLSCGIGGRGCLAAQVAAEFPAGQGGDGQGSILGLHRRCPPDLAAFWNTAMIRYLDHNDLMSAGHPSDIVGALLAVGSAVGASGKQVLSAMVIAYEVFGRIGDKILLERPTLDQGYAVTIATAAAACHLLGADREHMRHAISIAATSSVALRATRSGMLSDYKGVATSLSTRDGVFIAYLTRTGLTGPEAPFEGRHGILELVEGEAGPLELEGAGRFLILETCLKYFPTAYNMQPSVWAGLKLRELLGGPDRLASVVLHAAPFSWHESGSEPAKWDPQTRETADHSVPYVFAHALRHGEFDSSAYERAAYRDQATLTLMQQVAVEPDWERGSISPTVIGVRAVAIDVDGQEHVVEVDQPRGHHANPMTRDELSAKARMLMGPALGERTDAAIAAGWAVASFDDIGDMMAAYVVPTV